MPWNSQLFTIFHRYQAILFFLFTPLSGFSKWLVPVACNFNEVLHELIMSVSTTNRFSVRKVVVQCMRNAWLSIVMLDHHRRDCVGRRSRCGWLRCGTTVIDDGFRIEFRLNFVRMDFVSFDLYFIVLQRLFALLFEYPFAFFVCNWIAKRRSRIVEGNLIEVFGGRLTE